VHLPFFAAVADGLFAEHGLDVELVESAPGAERVKLLADGKGDFLLTATLYHLQALAEAGSLPVHAVGTLHRRSPVAAVVRADSDVAAAADVTGRRLGAPAGTQMGWLAVELQADLRRTGVGPPEVVDMSYPEAYAAIARGEIDLMANFADLLPIDERRAQTPLRAVAVGGDVHTSAVLAHDSVPDDLVERFVAAAAASFEHQRHDPGRGVDALRARYPEVDPEVAVDTWHRLDPYAFPIGEMDFAGWERTLAWNARTHGLPAATVDDAVRVDLLADRPTALRS
jgi:NitT/TauT family transport system substrate-binding protein